MIVPAGLAATFIANEEDIVSRPTHVTWEERATSGNDARFDADSAVLVASKQKAALQEHARALALRTVGLERVGVDAD